MNYLTEKSMSSGGTYPFHSYTFETLQVRLLHVTLLVIQFDVLGNMYYAAIINHGRLNRVPTGCVQQSFYILF